MPLKPFSAAASSQDQLMVRALHAPSFALHTRRSGCARHVSRPLLVLLGVAQVLLRADFLGLKSSSSCRNLTVTSWSSSDPLRMSADTGLAMQLVVRLCVRSSAWHSRAVHCALEGPLAAHVILVVLLEMLLNLRLVEVSASIVLAAVSAYVGLPASRVLGSPDNCPAHSRTSIF
eukprot:CAMPEP_0203893316 /NCGR_PEP_ID=MMETSP0359-20131031/36391_1 /ASSEMBLY_ACC=CAM_ASM_000338 /TAXON_ID=268821 /ORGANISM="Scrippsiella Hangoei, Strain SHTV-5" /LENGTH=174 /DNA_ID=CAMNT_0050815439 /DNA_START=215 /DNA_END=738 /DNA_ORIENTATION=-